MLLLQKVVVLLLLLLLLQVVEDGVLLGCCVAAAGSISGGCIEQVVIGSGMSTTSRYLPFESRRSTRRYDIGHHRRMQIDFQR
jgi:hypothetical protein